MTSTSLSLDPDRRSGYDASGIVHARALFAAAEVAEIRDQFMAQVQHSTAVAFDDHLPGDDPLARYPRFVHPHRHPDLEIGRLCRRLMLDDRVFSVVDELIGPAYAAQSMFYFKPPGARGQALHQDNFFLQAAPETCLAAWVAIDDVDRDNGGLAVVPGSHREELICPEPADRTVSFTTLEVAVPAGLTLVQTEMAAGDVLFFHGSLVHGSPPNRTADRFRRSLIFHYVPQRSVQVARFFQPLVDRHGNGVEIAVSPAGGPCGGTDEDLS